MKTEICVQSFYWLGWPQSSYPISMSGKQLISRFAYNSSIAILHLCLFWGSYFPSTNLADRAGNCYTSLYFYFSSFAMFIQSRILKLVVICSCCSFLFLLSIFFILLFSTLLSIPCSVFSLCLFSLFSDLHYDFLFKSVILSFLFSYNSVLSASPLCSLFSLSLYFSVLFTLPFLLLVLFFNFYCSLLSSLICYSSSYYWLTDFSSFFIIIYFYYITHIPNSENP